MDKLEKELNRPKRALWLARADRARATQMVFRCYAGIVFALGNMKEWDSKVQLSKKWERVGDKCRAYADKFKENG